MAASFDPSKFESIQQVGGIRTATFDHPDAGGAPACRVAMVDTGAGLRFTVALDRGGDIVEASYRDTNLTFLTPNGYVPPSHAYQHGADWMYSWPGGLVTCCGPLYMGQARVEDDVQTNLHGHHSNIPAAVRGIVNPDLMRGEHEMRLELTVRDTRMFGPVIELRRTIRCTLGEPVVTIEDTLMNRGNTTAPHNWLYHVNFGYPLLDADTRLVYRGKLNTAWPNVPADLDAYKTISEPLQRHSGTREDGVIVEPAADERGVAHVGIANRKRELGVAMRFDTEQLPRMANWQHLGRSSYVTALEPFAGSLKGKANDDHPLAAQWLEPGESRSYALTLQAVSGADAVGELLEQDGPVQA